MKLAAVLVVCLLACSGLALAARHDVRKRGRAGQVPVSHATRILSEKEFGHGGQREMATFAPERLQVDPRVLGPPSVARETRVLTVDHIPDPGSSSGFDAFRMREETGAARTNGIKVSPGTQVLSVEDYFQNSTIKHHIWTPNGQYPKKGGDWARALSIAKRSFMIVDVRHAESTPLVFYLHPNSTKAAPVVLPIRNGVRGKSRAHDNLAEAQGAGWHAACVYNSMPHGVSTSLRTILDDQSLGNRVQTARGMVAAMYSMCKANIALGIKRQRRQQAARAKEQKAEAAQGNADEIREAMEAGKESDEDDQQLPVEYGILQGLQPKSKEVSFQEMLDIWMNNVDVYWEGTDALRSIAVELAEEHRGDMEDNFWMFIENADSLVRHQREDSHHLYRRVLPGSWQAYFQYLSATRATAMNPIWGVNADTMAVLSLDDYATQFAFRVQGHVVRGLRALANQDEGVVHPETEEAYSSFLQTNTGEAEPSNEGFGLLSLLYPMHGNPGEIGTESLLGTGLVSVLVKMLKISVARNRDYVSDGEELPFPCFSEGVTLGQASIADPVRSQASTICWRNVEDNKFDSTLCNAVSHSTVMLEAAMNHKLKWVGRSNHEKCKDLLREVLNGPDDTIYSASLNRQLRDLVAERPKRFNSTIRGNLTHLMISSPGLSALLKEAAMVLPGLAGDADQTGLTVTELTEFAANMSGNFFGQMGVEYLSHDQYALPLLGAMLDVFVNERLMLSQWGGKVIFEELLWPIGAAVQYASLKTFHDNGYRQFYESKSYRVPLLGRHALPDTQQPGEHDLIDDFRKLPPNQQAKKFILSEARRANLV